MSTYTFMLLTSVAGSSFVGTQPASTSIQTGPPPVKIKGPAIIDSDSKRVTLSEMKVANYDYEVDLAQPAASDTVVHISDLTNAAQPLGYTITIPAGSQAGHFTVQAVFPGTDVLIANCTLGTGLLNITVL